MTPDELDRILSSEDAIAPSSGFTANVLAAVRMPQAEPVARHFPWLRFGAGVAASGLMAGAGAILLDRSAPALAALAPPFAAVTPQFPLAAAATVLSLAIAVVPRLLARE
jgi:hypothetical protein